MSIQLGTSKRLLNKKVDTVISRFKTEQLETLSAASVEDESSPYFIRESILQLEESIGAINTANTKIEELLREYAIELDELENASQKDQEDFEEYSSKAETALTSAFDYILLLQARLRAFKSCVDQIIPSASPTILGENIPNGGSSTTKFELPTLPIPTFRGNIWDWANFWELFNANVHSQPLPDLYKFNYLLNALEGDAYESVKKFQVIPDNYMKAIDFLRNKYENTEELVTRLIDRLENCQLRSPLLKDQRSLLEQIQVAIMQLLQQGEQVDGQWFIKQVLSKFPTTVQRKVLTKKHSLPAENPFKMGTLLKFLEEIISGEEMISLYMKKNFTSPSMDNPCKQTREQHKFRSSECMYCGKSHKSVECDRYKTPQERSKYLREHKLFLICASPQHLTSQCKKRHCFQCQGVHHTSCCFFKFHPHVRPSSPTTESSNQVHQAKRSRLKNNQAKDSRTTKSSRKVNQLTIEQPSEEETAILELQSAHGVKQAQGTFLSTGEMTALDPKVKTLRRFPTGQLNHLSQVTDETQLSEKDTWNGYWTLEAQVHMMATSLQIEEDNHEQDLWEKFWALETEEFSNSEREEQALVDKQVWNNFKNSVLLRFRIGRIAIISDVEKAFLQVRLHEVDRDATRCFWLRNHKLPPSNENVQVLRFTRVTFGLMASPFLLAATTHHHLDQYEHERKLVEEMKENLYVDNLILCVDAAEDAIYTCSRTKQMFKELNMNLREFPSNDPETIKSIPDKDRSSEHVPKVLRTKWDSASDCLEISCPLENSPSVTKRIVASVIASIYDPFGWLVPLLHKAKVFLRLLWEENSDWDTKVPQERENEWTRICEEIRGFREIIPRIPMIITFADASAEAIASYVYLRSSHSVNLMMAKGKLTTLKSATIMPKMELNAATLAMRLTNSVVSQLQSVLTIQQVFIFSDSEIVLGWIRKKPLKDAGLMVFNRLVEIDKIIASLQNLGCHVQFGHVPSIENPADGGTRGLGKTEFLNHFWWEGPKFLKKEPQTWANEYKLFHPDSSSEGSEEEQATHKEARVSTSTKTPRKPSCVDIFSPLQSHSLVILKCIVAYVLRFIRILVTRISKKRTHPVVVTPLLKEPLEAQKTSLSAAEIVIASKILVKQHQLAMITQVIIRSMPHLNVQKDEEGLFRCFGRLGNSTLENEKRNPLIILQNSWLAQAVIRDYHIKRHPGISHTMALLGILPQVELVNVLSHSSTICTEYEMGQACKIQLSEILKINPFKREACFKLTRNQTTIHEIRASWKSLILTCEKETDYFTRDTDHNVIDSKRCPHMGSCVSNKRAAVNSSSIIPELDIFNKYPGNTYCVESCGGPGCDCFYWRSGCLFYRIYLTPRTTQVFEVYHCNRWQETVAFEFTHFDAVKGKTKTFSAHMLPNVPIKWKSFTFTLTSITVPPMPLLHTSFISDGNNTALWKAELKPSSCCNNETAATKLRFTKAEVLCDTTSFTIPCDRGGIESVLRFSFSRAQVQVKRSVSCGEVVSEFEIGSILKFTDTIHGSMIRWLEGRSNSLTEFQLPDIWHIANVFLQWYKTLIATLVTLLVMSQRRRRRWRDDVPSSIYASDKSNSIRSGNATPSGAERNPSTSESCRHGWSSMDLHDGRHHLSAGGTRTANSPHEQMPQDSNGHKGGDLKIGNLVYPDGPDLRNACGGMQDLSGEETRMAARRDTPRTRRPSSKCIEPGQKSAELRQDEYPKYAGPPDQVRKEIKEILRGRPWIPRSSFGRSAEGGMEHRRGKVDHANLGIAGQLQEREKRIEQLEAKVVKIEQAAAGDPSRPDERKGEERVVSNHESSRSRRHSVDDRQVQAVEDQGVPDAEYWERMVDEIKEDRRADSSADPFQEPKLIPISPATSEEGVEPLPKSPRMERHPVSRWGAMSTEMLEREVAEMKRYFQVFPFRKLGDSSRGMQGDIICAFCEAECQHYSDSCAQVVNGDQRLEIINIKGWCKYYWEDCPAYALDMGSD
ncbi:Pao retrotransposon peptidase [Ancylostoma duodenale]|uniref:Pao retrotransposon peptidase n=1 Tax=Ancylostoma duodenale TaxID=51022 RepID=A0A0C2HA02_9BILA|nr:Pao retrotransposon peptidase [Ancylostoma duodenale]